MEKTSTVVQFQYLVEQINEKLKTTSISEKEIIGDMKELLSNVSHPNEIWNDFLQNSIERDRPQVLKFILSQHGTASMKLSDYAIIVSLRAACHTGNLKTVKVFLESDSLKKYFAKVSGLPVYVVQKGAEAGQAHIVDYILNTYSDRHEEIIKSNNFYALNCAGDSHKKDLLTVFLKHMEKSTVISPKQVLEAIYSSVKIIPEHYVATVQTIERHIVEQEQSYIKKELGENPTNLKKKQSKPAKI